MHRHRNKSNPNLYASTDGLLAKFIDNRSQERLNDTPIKNDTLKLLDEKNFLVITGRNGTGKTKLLNKYVQFNESNNKQVVYIGAEAAITTLKVDSKHRHAKNGPSDCDTCIDTIINIIQEDNPNHYI